MADQLSLRLDPSLPHLPPSLRPMTAVPAAGPFDSFEHLFEPTWGGARALAFIETDPGPGREAFRLLDDAGRDLAPLVPELSAFGERVVATSAIVDGELIVV